MSLLEQDPVPLAPGCMVPMRLLHFAYSRSSGPGGQHVNKTSTQAELRVSLADLADGFLDAGALQRLRRLAGRRVTEAGELILVASSERSQRGNREACLQRLADLVTQAYQRPKRRRATKPGRGAVQRRLDSKRKRSNSKRRRNERFD